jgi:hypothetical protein
MTWLPLRDPWDPAYAAEADRMNPVDHMLFETLQSEVANLRRDLEAFIARTEEHMSAIPEHLQGSFAVSIGGDGTVTVKKGAGRGDEVLSDGEVHALGSLLAELTEGADMTREESLQEDDEERAEWIRDPSIPARVLHRP